MLIAKIGAGDIINVKPLTDKTVMIRRSPAHPALEEV